MSCVCNLKAQASVSSFPRMQGVFDNATKLADSAMAMRRAQACLMSEALIQESQTLSSRASPYAGSGVMMRISTNPPFNFSDFPPAFAAAIPEATGAANS